MIPASQLFLVRLWKETRRDDEFQVRIQVRHVLSGETYNFRNWSDIVTYLTVKLDELSDVYEEQKEDG